MEMVVAVASRSFSASSTLRDALVHEFPAARFNVEGSRLAGDSLVQFLDGAKAAILGIEPLTRDVIDQLPALRLVSKYGVGTDSFDLVALEECGIALALTHGTNAQAVAEHTLLLMLGCLRRLPEAQANVLERRWVPVTGQLLQGKTVGLLGVGHVGRSLAGLLRAFDCTILGFDLAQVDTSGVEFVALEDLLAAADVVSVHLPLTDQTRGMIDAGNLSRMKAGAILINTSRGAVVDDDALMAALSSGRIRAGLDVLSIEPPLSWGLTGLPNVLLTPHIAGSSEESNLAMGYAAIDGLVRNRDRMAP